MDIFWKHNAELNANFQMPFYKVQVQEKPKTVETKKYIQDFKEQEW